MVLSFTAALTILLIPRLTGSVVSYITDCDEVFNYWEPLHYILHGTGLQTWEYSPEYALRSYFYLLPHATPSLMLAAFGVSNKVAAFYSTRAVLGGVSAVAEARLCAAASRSRAFGDRVAWFVLGFLALSPGMFHASVAFLPSTTAMVLCTLAFGTWMDGDYRMSIVCIAASTILVWPFSGALGIPIAVDILFFRQDFFLFGSTAALSLVLLLVPSMYVDSAYYGRPVFAGLNIVMYNVLSDATSSELYGTEPWTFYFVNGALNLNVAFVLGICGPALAFLKAIRGGIPQALLYLSPLALWMGIFFPQAHKEERFLFPVYPLICLSGAATLVWSTDWICEGVRQISQVERVASTARRLLPAMAFALFCALSLSRTVATHRGYHAPMEIYNEVAKLNVAEEGARICVGKEWFRYSSSFFLPEQLTPGGGAVTLEFIKSGYDGLLPKPFAKANGTSVIPEDMNNMNREEPSRYVVLSTCDFAVDRDDGDGSALSSRDGWERVACRPFLDATRTSSAIFRALYIPLIDESRVVFSDYCLLKNTRHKKK
mmetsp:Transcript_17144/g.44666  ORF Transcript_17144/g.44666 Transcript_17144/m.44666 type:complete len:545 (+) Transcript_17144:101-1735(+)